MFELIFACAIQPCAKPDRFATLEMCQRVGIAHPKPFTCKPLLRPKPFDLYELTTHITLSTGRVLSHKTKGLFSKSVCDIRGHRYMEGWLLNGNPDTIKSATYKCHAVVDA